ncbi:hypothetical protein CAFE_03500 [Caprobacter fermentans]|uniref:DUF4367 domain-containing protein n=1 Tax=Caproicibacter fermentans TaxID=2576756 RepID=A0A6N8HVQ9_9FIRM|nr:DUF4367 domain-containing protein [Caproicibacter fermentans]MVB09685.1 hypothetical protein [Caproicibacter fermentans]
MLTNYSEESLKAAVIAADRMFLDSLPSDDEINHVFSKRFERHMKKLIQKCSSGKTTAKSHIVRKRWIAILVSVIMVFSMALSVSAVRQSIYRFVSQIYEKYTQILFSQTSSSQTDSLVFEAYIPSYIPDGFQLVHQEKNDIVMLEYEKGKDFVSYDQEPLENVSARINTEGVKIEDTKLNGTPAQYYSNKGIQNLIWYDSRYMYMISSTLDRKTVFRIAESVPMKKD